MCCCLPRIRSRCLEVYTLNKVYSPGGWPGSLLSASGRACLQLISFHARLARELAARQLQCRRCRVLSWRATSRMTRGRRHHRPRSRGRRNMVSLALNCMKSADAEAHSQPPPRADGHTPPRRCGARAHDGRKVRPEWRSGRPTRWARHGRTARHPGRGPCTSSRARAVRANVFTLRCAGAVGREATVESDGTALQVEVTRAPSAERNSSRSRAAYSMPM
jgi:hypothetical protein